MDTDKEKKYQIGKQILTQNDVHKVINVKGEAFKVKFPTPIEQNGIEREVALRLGGLSLDSIPQAAYNQIRMCVTLDIVLTDKPDWWDSAGDCYDEELVADLWEKYIEAKEAFRRSIREGRFKRDSS